MKNLWKDLDSLTSDMKNPIDLIREQSNFLTDGTDGVFYFGDTILTKLGTYTRGVLGQECIESKFRYKIDICSQFLPEYSFNIFNFYYDITFYPLLMNVPSEIGEEIEIEGVFCNVDAADVRRYYKIESQEEFEEILCAIFNCEKLRTIMKNMRAIIGDVAHEE